jgi:gliding motility-associated-like protein
MKNIIKIVFLTLFSFAFFTNAHAQLDTVKVTLSEVKGSPGDTVCVDIKVANLKKIGGMQFTINWDNTKMDFVNATNYNSLAKGDFQIPVVSSSKITCVYIDASTQGTTLPDGAIIFSVCFKIKMPIGQNDKVCLVGTPTPIEFSSNAGTVVPFKIINCGLVESVIPDLKPLKLYGSFEIAKQNDTACVVYKVDDFTKIKTMNFQMSWDISKLKFEYISMIDKKIDPTGTTPFYIVKTANGTIDIKWNAGLAGLPNLTLPNGTPIFKLCFKTLCPQEGIVTPIEISGSPNAPFIVTANSNNQNVGMTGTTGKVKCPQTKFLPVTLTIPSQNVSNGKVFCLDIKGSNMDSLISFAYALQWDAEALEFVEIKNIYPFPSAINVNFNSTKSVSDGINGVLVDSPNAPFTLPKNTVLYQVCLKPTGLLGCSEIKINSIEKPFPQAYNNQTQQDIGVTSNIGKICVESIIQIKDTTLVSPNCLVPLSGSIKINPTGGTGPYTYQWSPNAFNAKTKDVDKIPSGIFYVTISDASVPKNVVVGKFNLPQSKAPDAKAKVVGILDCKGNNMVTLDGTGSTTGANIKYKWKSETGIIMGSDSSLTAKAISATKYYLELTDKTTGCIDTSNVVTVSAPDVPNVVMQPAPFLACTNVVGVQINGCSSTPTNQVSYKWGTLNGAFVGTTQTPSKCNPIVNKPGDYILTVTNTSNSCTAVEKVTVLADQNIPKAVATVKDTINCDNETVQLYGDKSSSDVTSFSWSPLGVGTVLNDKNAIATVDKADKYVLVVKNAQGCLATDTVKVYDLRADTASISVQDKYFLGCQNVKITIDACKSSQKNVTYAWFPSPTFGGNIVGPANGCSIQVDKEGKYIFTVKNKYSKCEATTVVSVLPPSNVPAQVNAGKDTTLTCLVNKIQLKGTSDVNPDYTYKWSGGTGIIGDQTLTPTVTKAGLYFLTVLNTKNGCKTVDSVKVVENKEKPQAKIGGDPKEYFTCGKTTILLNASSSVNADTYNWVATNGGKVGTGANTQNAVAEKAGTYTLIVTRNDNGCVDSIQRIIPFKYPEKGFAGNDSLLCKAAVITLTATVPNGGTGKWTTFGNAYIADKTNNITEIDSLAKGKNIFVWTSSAPGCPDYASDTLVVFIEKPINAKDDIVTQKNKSEYFTVPVTINDDLKSTKAYTLKAIGKPEYGNLDETATKSGFRYKPSDCFAGTQLFKYVVSSNFCPQYRDTAEVKLLITADPAACNDVVIPNTITPNSDGLNDFFRIDAIEFQPERFKDAELTVFNRWGDVVYRKRPYKNEWQGTSQGGGTLPQGTYYYILNLNLSDGVVYRGDITILK